MIGRLTGALVAQEPDGACIVDVAGVGYEVFLPIGAAFGDGPQTLFVHTHVREDAMVLFGFRTARDRAAFRALLSVSGVGPRVALAILGVLDADALLDAVRSQNAPAFKGIPGVGKKTTERILLDLRDRLENVLGPGIPMTKTIASRPASGNPTLRTVHQALTQLGFRSQEAEGALAQLEPYDKTVEQLLREALTLLS